MPEWPAAGVEQGAVAVVVVTAGGDGVLGDDVLQVGVLPVEITGLDGSCEHRPVGPGQGV